MTRALLLAALLLGCAHKPTQAPQDTRARVRDCITGGEPSTVEDWKLLTLECTE